MNPSIELRIKTMIRALTEIIIPAVDQNNSLAQEQAGLLVGHLNVLLAHQGREHLMRNVEHEALKELGTALVAESDGGDVTMAASASLNEHIKHSDIDSLAHAIEKLVVDAGVDGSDAFKSVCNTLVIQHARAETLRARIWFKAIGFDHDPGTLPEIDELFR